MTMDLEGNRDNFGNKSSLTALVLSVWRAKKTGSIRRQQVVAWRNNRQNTITIGPIWALHLNCAIASGHFENRRVRRFAFDISVCCCDFQFLTLAREFESRNNDIVDS